MLIAHLSASTFYGGPERQILGLCDHLPASYRALLLSFPEGGRCESYVSAARERGHAAHSLNNDTPRFRTVIREVTEKLRAASVNVLCCHGYKPALLGRIAARRLGIPVVVVSRGWTGENLKVQLYELLDRLNLHWVDSVVCVSNAQAERVVFNGASRGLVQVIHNAIDTRRFHVPRDRARAQLLEFFSNRPKYIVGAMGRLSPEKGFETFVRAAVRLTKLRSDVGCIHFGAGQLHGKLQSIIERAGLSDRVILAGCRSDLDDLIAGLDVSTLPSFTEGLPNVVLESLAAGVPVVATAVGGTPEIVQHGREGLLVAPGNVDALLEALRTLLASSNVRQQMAERGQARVNQEFTFARQAECYQRLFRQLQPNAN